MKKRIKWNNVCKLILLGICLSIILYDMCNLLIIPFFTKELTSWTCFGFITFVLSIYVSTNIYEQIKSVSNTGTVKHTK